VGLCGQKLEMMDEAGQANMLVRIRTVRLLSSWATFTTLALSATWLCSFRLIPQISLLPPSSLRPSPFPGRRFFISLLGPAMAILGKFGVEVTVDGTLAREYDDDDNAPVKPNSVTKYVEAIAGAGFGFVVRVDPSYRFTDEDSLFVGLYIDGKSGGDPLITRQWFEDRVRRGRTPMISVTGKYAVRSSGPAFYKFEFANLETRRSPDGETLPIRY